MTRPGPSSSDRTRPGTVLEEYLQHEERLLTRLERHLEVAGGGSPAVARRLERLRAQHDGLLRLIEDHRRSA